MTNNTDIDLQTGELVNVGKITMENGAQGLDMQATAIVNAFGLTMVGGGGNADLQGGQLINTVAISSLSGGFITLGHNKQIVIDSTPTGTTQTVNWDNGNAHYIDLGSATGNVTLTINSGAQGGTYYLRAHNNGSSRDIIWPAAVKWVGGVTPVVTTGAAAEDLFILHFDGTNYLAQALQAHS